MFHQIALLRKRLVAEAEPTGTQFRALFCVRPPPF